MVDAWLYPLDRANVALKSMAANCHRNDLILASYFLIASVNDHILPKASKAKQSRHTLKSRVLQEDCCSRLARILQRHGLGLTDADAEHDFNKELLPPIDILEKGIFVLFKQLRYTPFARVLLEPQFLLQKFKPVFKPRDPTTTLDSSGGTGGIDDIDGNVTGGNEGDDLFFNVEVEPRNHPDSPYPPLEEDLNKWMEGGQARVGRTQSRSQHVPPRNVMKLAMNDDSDSPYEDGDFGTANTPGFQVSFIHIEW